MEKDGPSWQGDALVTASGVQAQELPAAALYVVATPIGNAADLTLRALWVLARVDAIAAEDTRTTAPLLARFGIGTPLFAAHRHNERAASEAVLARLAAGQRVALVSDAGTPAVSDPGARVVQAALAAGHRVIPVPGASSVLAAVAAAGLADGPVTLAGFLPTGAAERMRQLRTLAARGDACVLFEAPHRIGALARALREVLAPDRRVVLARELTKKFEQVQATTAAALDPDALDARGEYVVLIDAAPVPLAALDGGTDRWLVALAAALPASRAAAVAARATGLPRAALYERLLGLAGSGAGGGTNGPDPDGSPAPAASD